MRFLSIILLFVTMGSFCQQNTDSLLANLFYNLPIKEDLQTIIHEVEKNPSINANFEYAPITRSISFGGSFTTNPIIENIPNEGTISGFTSKYYTLWGHELDSLTIIAIRINYGSKVSNELKKEYKKLNKHFGKVAAKKEKYKLYADSGLVGYGKCYFETEKDSLPYFAVEIGLGSCVSVTKSLIIQYYKP